MTTEAPKLQIEYVPIGKLKPFEGNPRKNDAAVTEIVQSIEHYGYTNPILVRRENNEVIAGHTRLLALKDIGEETAPVVFLDMTEDQAHAYGIFDNKSTENTEWDVPKLTDLIEQLTTDGAEFENLGFTEDELAEMQPVFDGEPDPKDDIVPDPPKVPKTKPGDLYLLGEHRLICGDATKAEDVDRLMDGEKADMVFTDPPYNINYGNIKHPKFRQREIQNDNMNEEDFVSFCTAFASCIASVCSGCIYVFGHPGQEGRIMFSVLDKAFHCSTTVIWNKDQFTLGRGKYQNKYEPCWFGWNNDGVLFCDDRTLTNVWDFPRPKSSKEHPTMKPVELVCYAISHIKGDNCTVYDPFLGSGTTIIAAEKLNRKCYGLEIDPIYCDVIVKRWEEFTGKKAELSL